MLPGEDTNGWGTQVYPGVNAHNHQHMVSCDLFFGDKTYRTWPNHFR